MKKSLVRVLSLVLTVFLMGSIMAGCGSTKTVETQSTTKAAATVETTAEVQDVGYPIKTTETLTYWTTWVLHKDYKAPEEQPFFQQLEKETGVKVKWIFSGTSGDVIKQNFNLMIASGDLPDIIQYDWGNTWGVPQGAQSYIDNKYIVKLNDIMEKSAPNLTKYLNENPEANKMVKTDEGSYYAFPFLRGDKYLCVYQGSMIRKDFLDKVGLAIPETVDEWHTMLVAFKDQLGLVAPFTFDQGDMWNSSQMIGAYKAQRGMYLNADGKVVFGSFEPQYKEAMTTLAAWYKEGLIDQDIATVNASVRNQRILSGQSGAAIGNGGTIGLLLPQLQEKDSKADLVGAKYPVLNKGDYPEFGQYDNPFGGAGCAAITTACKDVELAAKYLDYAYSTEGQLLYNFGIEGESYTMVDGKPTFTEAMYKYDGDLGTSIQRYIATIGTAPTIQNADMYKQRLQFQQQKEAIELFSATNASKYKMPPVSATEVESKESGKLENDLGTYAAEMYFKFMLGAESLDNFDAYVKKAKDMGLDRLLELKQAAVERYNKR